jgi:hypothetical protein
MGVAIRRTRQIVVAMAMLSTLCHTCSLAVGFFHQVTSIRGKVVGSSWMPVRWARQSVSVSDATLTLYEYRFPAKPEDRKKIAVVTTDKRGAFDFGAIPKGHYSLHIEVRDSDRMGGWFDVEVTDAARATKNIMIDVSPIHPDCTGGHEFIETKF